MSLGSALATAMAGLRANQAALSIVVVERRERADARLRQRRASIRSK